MPAVERDPAWQRRLAWALAVLAALWPLVVATEFYPAGLLDPRSLRATLDFVGTMLPPAHAADFLQLVARETWRTVAMATAGMALAMLMAIPAALLSTRALSVSALSGRMARGPFWLRQAIRWTMIVLRSVPELVWALVFVRVVGLGSTSGVLAIALAYGGMLGKVYADILETGDAHATDTLLRNGCGRLQAFFYGLLPQNATELASYTVYRWECAIRSSVVLGFVGAGGLGQLLDGSMKMFNGGEVTTILAVFVVLVMLADRASSALRGHTRAATGRLSLVVLALAFASFWTLDLQWAQFMSMDALHGMGRFVGEFFPPDTSADFLLLVARGTWETFAMSALGTLLAAVAGLALAVPASRMHAGDGARARIPTRLVLNGLRSVPELVWAALLLIAAGLGPFAGTVALALHTTGVLGRLFAESLENAPPGPADALRAQGVDATRVFFYATLPQVLPQVLSYTLYRWENNIRAAAVLGVVGAGGLGQLLAFHMGLFHMGKTATVLAAMLVLVAIVDAASYAARRVMAR